jgi:hypothetical protein
MTFYDLTKNRTHGQGIIDCTYIQDFPNLDELGLVQDFETVGSA